MKTCFDMLWWPFRAYFNLRLSSSRVKLSGLRFVNSSRLTIYIALRYLPRSLVHVLDFSLLCYLGLNLLTGSPLLAKDTSYDARI
jgi:hypothetical protein